MPALKISSGSDCRRIHAAVLCNKSDDACLLPQPPDPPQKKREMGNGQLGVGDEGREAVL